MTRGAKYWGMLQKLATVALIVFWAGSASAQDSSHQITFEPPPPPPTTGKFGLAFGAAGTTDYVSRGITQTGSDPAIQGYIEPSYSVGPALGDLFVNVWASNVDFGSGFDGTEIDVSGGIRPKFLGPKWAPTIGWWHYFYAPEDVSPDYGEVFAQTDYTFGKDDKFQLRGLVFFAPNYSQTNFTATWVAGGGRVKLWKNFMVYAGAGYQFFEDPNAFEQLAWTAGASYFWKSLTFDVRYWGTDLSEDECVVRSGFRDGCDARVVGTISWDTTWKDFFLRR